MSVVFNDQRNRHRADVLAVRLTTTRKRARSRLIRWMTSMSAMLTVSFI